MILLYSLASYHPSLGKEKRKSPAFRVFFLTVLVPKHLSMTGESHVTGHKDRVAKCRCTLCIASVLVQSPSQIFLLVPIVTRTGFFFFFPSSVCSHPSFSADDLPSLFREIKKAVDW